MLSSCAFLFFLVLGDPTASDFKEESLTSRVWAAIPLDGYELSQNKAEMLPSGMLHLYSMFPSLSLRANVEVTNLKSENKMLYWTSAFFCTFPLASHCLWASKLLWTVLFPATLVQRNLPWMSVFRHRGWSSTIPEALGSAVISWLSAHNGWKLSYYLSVLSKGKGSCGAERPRKTLVLIFLKGVGQPS